jgi:hypothetical protein
MKWGIEPWEFSYLTIDKSGPGTRDETPFFEKLVKDFRRPLKLTDESQVRRVKVDRIKDGLRIPTRSRIKRRYDLFTRQEKLQKRPPRKRDHQRRRVDR